MPYSSRADHACEHTPSRTELLCKADCTPSRSITTHAVSTICAPTTIVCVWHGFFFFMRAGARLKVVVLGREYSPKLAERKNKNSWLWFPVRPIKLTAKMINRFGVAMRRWRLAEAGIHPSFLLWRAAWASKSPGHRYVPAIVGMQRQ